MPATSHEEIIVPAGGAEIAATFSLPSGTRGVVIFAHGSGSSRHSPRNRRVAELLQEDGFATLLVDLLSARRDSGLDLRFDVTLLGERLSAASEWLSGRLPNVPVGYFGASTGAAAALIAASQMPRKVDAIVSRGGRPDLAGEHLARVRAPTLLIVGGADPVVLDLNTRALDALTCEKRLEIIPGATHLFEEPGAIERVAMLATQWLSKHMA